MDTKTFKALVNDPDIRRYILTELYENAYNEIQRLDGSGFHSNNEVNRQDALDALKKAYRKCLTE